MVAPLSRVEELVEPPNVVRALSGQFFEDPNVTRRDCLDFSL